MPVGSTDFGQGNGYAFGHFYTAGSVAFEYPPAQVSTTQSAFIAFVCQIDRALLGSEFHPATYATVFGNTTAPHTVNTVLCRYHGPEDADVALQNRFVFYVTDSANNANGGPWAVVPGGGGGNVTVRIVSEPIETDGPVAVILQVYRSLNGAGVATLQRAQVLTAHSDANGNTVTQQSAVQDLDNFSGTNTLCPPWALGAASTSGVVTGGNYWPGLLSQFIVGFGWQFLAEDVDAFFEGRWFPKSPSGNVSPVTGRFARRLGYALSGVSSSPRPWTDVTDSLNSLVDTYPPLTFNGTFRDGGCLTAVPLDAHPFKSMRWQTRPRVDMLASNLVVPRKLWLRCFAAAGGDSRGFTLSVRRYDAASFNEHVEVATYNVSPQISAGGVAEDHVLSFDTVYSPASSPNKQAFDIAVVTVGSSPNSVLFAKQYSWTNCNRDVVVLDSHSKSGIVKTFGRETARDPLGFSLVIRQPSGLYLRIREYKQLGLKQFLDVPVGELVVLDRSTQDTGTVASSGILNTFRTEVLSATGRISRWVHAHHRYPTLEDAASIAATATANLNTLYNNANYAAINVVVLDPGRFGPQSELGLGTSRPALYHQNLREACRAWGVSAANRRFVDHANYAGAWDAGNVPYMRVADNLLVVTRYLRRLYLNLDVLATGLLNSLLADYRPAQFVDAAKTQFVVRLAPALATPTVTPPFVMHTAGARPALEISEDGGATWLRPENPADIGLPAYFGTALLANGTILVGKAPSSGFSWSSVTPGQLRVRFGYGFPSLNVEVPAALSGAAAYQHIMAADGAVYQQSSAATPYFETGIVVPPFDVVVSEPAVVSAGTTRSLSSTGAGR